jgi:hypothetical protein
MNKEKLIELVKKSLKYEQESYMPHYGTIDNLQEILVALERNHNEEISR